MFAFERQFLTEEDMAEGLIHERFHIPVTLAIFFGLLSIAYPSLNGLTEYAFWGFTSLILARLVALDLTNHTLPNIYVAPLALLSFVGIAIGAVALSWQQALLGGFIGFGAILFFSFLIEFMLKSAFLGGGDIKLIGASGLWLGAALLPFYMMAACFISIALSFIPNKNGHIAFGPGLCLSLWLFLHQKTWLMALINKVFAFIS